MPLKAAIVPVTPFQQNCTLLWDEATKRGASSIPAGPARIVAGIEKTGMTPEKILLTHGHLDHAGGAAELKEKLGGIPIEGPHGRTSFCSTGSPHRGSYGGGGAAQRDARPLARRGRHGDGRRRRSRCCIVPGIRRARWCWSTRRSALRWSAT